MADNYVQFSEVLAHLTDAEVAWLRDQLQPVVIIHDQELPADSPAVTVAEHEATWRGPRFLLGCDDESGWGDEPEFSYEFSLHEPQGQWGRHLWIYSQEYGNVDQVAQLVQKFLRQFRPHDCWSLTYAATCSKPRVSEFGGGAVLVTAERIRWHDASAIVAAAEKRHARRRTAVA